MPLTFSSVTPSARATRTTSVMISSAKRRARCSRSTRPSWAPARVPRVEMAQLIANLLHRAPAKLPAISTGPIGSRSSANASRRGSSAPSIRPRVKPPSLVRSNTPGSGMLAPKPTMAPNTESAPGSSASRSARATRSSQRPFCITTSAPPSASRAATEQAASTTASGGVASRIQSKRPSSSPGVVRIDP